MGLSALGPAVVGAGLVLVLLAVAGRAFPCLGWILGLACLSLLRGAISMPTLFLAVSLLLSSRARSKLLPALSEKAVEP